MNNDEMVEKARAWRDEFVGVYQPNEDTETTAGELDGYLAKFARSAVRDAVRECIQIALSEQVDAAETQEESDAAYNLACQHVASALRKKFEVEPETEGQ